MLLLKVLVYACAGFGLLFLFTVFVGKFIALGNRAIGRPCYTVTWRRHGNVLCAYRGTVTPLDDWHVVIEGDEGPVVVDRRNIVEAS